MTYAEIRGMAMFQTGNDTADYTEYEPSLGAYINEGYGKLLYAYDKTRVGDETSPALAKDTDAPGIPEHAHRAIADYATYMLYRNGSPERQRRGAPYYQQFYEVLSGLAQQSGTNVQFTNMFR